MDVWTSPAGLTHAADFGEMRTFCGKRIGRLGSGWRPVPRERLVCCQVCLLQPAAVVPWKQRPWYRGQK